MPRKITHTFLSAAQIRDAFGGGVSELEQLGLRDEIRNLSRAIGALRDGGLDVEFEISGWPGSASFLGENECNADINGTLRIGNNRHVLSLLTNDDASRKFWALSFYNASFGSVEDRKEEFSLYDRDCYQKLQQRIINLAVENKFIEENDVACAFNHGPRDNRFQLAKPALLKPGHPV